MAGQTNTDRMREPDSDHLNRQVIAAQNDVFRKVLGRDAFWHSIEIQGRVLTTPGFRALDEETRSLLLAKVMNVSDFTADNDPWNDHSFGRVEANGATIFWKIDLYDTAYSYGIGDLNDAADPEQTRRVLTLMQPSEY